MFNKKTAATAGIILFIGALALTIVLPEKKYFHLPFHAALIGVLIMSVAFTIKDTLIITLFFASMAWTLCFFGLISGINTLLLETAVLFLCGLALGWYEVKRRIEFEKQQAIIDYKASQVNEVKESMEKLKKENNDISSEIKRLRGKFAL